MTDRNLYRWGGRAAAGGALLALAANALHPRISDFDDPVTATIDEVAGSDAWIPLHLALVVAILLITAGLFALARYLKSGPAEGLSRVALGSLLVSTPIALVTLGIDGYSSKAAADTWAAAAGAARDPAFAAAAAVVTVAWGAFMLMIITYLGLTPLLFGLAMAQSGEYPAATGWSVAVLGGVAMLAGITGFGGQSTLFWVLFLVTSGLLTLWVLAVGLWLSRRGAAVHPAPADT